MENAARQAMARERRPVRCRNCGYAFTPVSGFCPNCLQLYPLGRRIGLFPIVAVLAVIALGAAVFAASLTGTIALRPAPNQASPSTSPSAQRSSAAVQGGASPSAIAPAPSSSATASAPPSGTSTPSTAPTPTSVAAASQASPAVASPSPTAVAGNLNTPNPSGTLPSTSTWPGTGTSWRRY